MKRTCILPILSLGLLTCLAPAQEGPPPSGGERPAGGPGGSGGSRSNPLIAALDANGDHNIDAAELAKATELLKKLDKDGDGQISSTEYRGSRPEGGRPGGPSDAPPAGGAERPERPARDAAPAGGEGRPAAPAGETRPERPARPENGEGRPAPEGAPPADGPPPSGPGGPGGQRPVFPLMLALDPNKDEEIDAKEMANSLEALKSLDKDKNGKLTAEEIRPSRPTGGPGGSGGGGAGGGRQGGRPAGGEGGAPGGRPAAGEGAPARPAL